MSFGSFQAQHLFFGKSPPGRHQSSALNRTIIHQHSVIYSRLSERRLVKFTIQALQLRCQSKALTFFPNRIERPTVNLAGFGTAASFVPIAEIAMASLRRGSCQFGQKTACRSCPLDTNGLVATVNTTLVKQVLISCRKRETILHSVGYADYSQVCLRVRNRPR